jgi:hypothetical protein
MTHPIASKLKQHARLLRLSGLRPLALDLRRWVWSDDVALGLKRDLTRPHAPPPARVALDILPLDDELARRLFDQQGLDPESLLDMEARRRMWEDQIPKAFVAVDDTGDPCYVQWAIPGSESDLIREYFRGGFPELAHDEMLLEAAWARPSARGKRIMSEAMSRIAETAGTAHRSAITFVGIGNEPSLRGCRAAGFEVYLQRRETWRLGHRSVAWAPPPRSVRTQTDGGVDTGLGGNA